MLPLPKAPVAPFETHSTLDCGEGVELFISGSSAQLDDDLHTGAGSALFISGSSPSEEQSLASGAQTGLFISGS